MPISSIRGCRKVLIVDDAQAVAETLKLIVSRQGHEVRVAQSAEDAFQLIASWQPDLALLDVMLPGISGIEFAKILRSTYPKCEIVLVSGHPDAKELLEIARSKGDAFPILPKPLEPALIVALAAGREQLSGEAANA
jgi:CheY-like chemotaxis protein